MRFVRCTTTKVSFHNSAWIKDDREQCTIKLPPSASSNWYQTGWWRGHLYVSQLHRFIPPNTVLSLPIDAITKSKNFLLKQKKRRNLSFVWSILIDLESVRSNPDGQLDWWPSAGSDDSETFVWVVLRSGRQLSPSYCTCTVVPPLLLQGTSYNKLQYRLVEWWDDSAKDATASKSFLYASNYTLNT